MIKQTIGTDTPPEAPKTRQRSEFRRMHVEEGTPPRAIINGSRKCVKCEKSDLWCACFLGCSDNEPVHQ